MENRGPSYLHLKIHSIIGRLFKVLKEKKNVRDIIDFYEELWNAFIYNRPLGLELHET
ncbi:hypothetical protein M8C21_033342 [Ambrosia artemisiifolia]|uniref:Uncharacterized protein n=1 Tax=Ambrosia artemisiifolia TaxID=4212 RepID=A0AAD5GPG4_AMBAR|nr:hypothetical protein M8C21_033342 [Ambrosia artemisiifolia]